jgi:hypothetical protein
MRFCTTRHGIALAVRKGSLCPARVAPAPARPRPRSSLGPHRKRAVVAPSRRPAVGLRVPARSRVATTAGCQTGCGPTSPLPMPNGVCASGCIGRICPSPNSGSATAAAGAGAGLRRHGLQYQEVGAPTLPPTSGNRLRQMVLASRVATTSPRPWFVSRTRHYNSLLHNYIYYLHHASDLGNRLSKEP